MPVVKRGEGRSGEAAPVSTSSISRARVGRHTPAAYDMCDPSLVETTAGDSRGCLTVSSPNKI